MNASSRMILCFFFCAISLFLGCAGANERHDELGITKVVLYQNGVGYFERHGEVEGNELRLQVRPDQVNDMLMSLTVIDRTNKGDAVSISLPVEKSAAMMLGELPPGVTHEGGLVAVLQAFRGANVDVSTKSGGSSDGQIVGVEEVNGGGWRLTILDEDGALIPIRVSDISKIDLEDRTLHVGLKKALEVSLGEGDWKPLEMVVHFPKDGTHEVAMSYIVAMPTWKPAYRLILDKEGGAFLQGWAVVDNISGEDWNNVELSLTAGTPISFIVDLHSPRLPSRPDLTSRTFTASSEVPPETLEGYMSARPLSVVTKKSSIPRGTGSGRSRRESKRSGYEKSADKSRYDFAESGSMDDDSSGAYPDPSPTPAPAISVEEMANALGGVSAGGEKVGSLFRYDIPSRVTVPDRSSALVTIINTPIDGEDVFFYDPSGGSSRAQRHPYRAVRLHNTSDFTIERGPLTIYNNSTFVGEGIANQLAPGQTVFIPYSLESSVIVQRSTGSASGLQTLVKIKDGIATIESRSLSSQTFDVTNNQTEDSVVYARVDRFGGYELLDDTDIISQGRAYFARIPVKAGETVKKVVTQAHKTRSKLQLFNGNVMKALALYIDAPDADPSVRAKLNEVLAFQKQIGDFEHRRESLTVKQSQLHSRASDLRRSIRTLGEASSNRTLKEKLAKKLGGVDKQLGEINRELVEINEKRYNIEVQMREKFTEITLDEKKDQK